jgi:hypothetical protein
VCIWNFYKIVFKIRLLKNSCKFVKFVVYFQGKSVKSVVHFEGKPVPQQVEASDTDVWKPKLVWVKMAFFRMLQVYWVIR